MELEGAFFNITDYKKTDTKLGKGSFGEVFIVKKISDGSPYAAKIINICKMFTGKEQQQLIRESSILHNLKHPAIVKFYGINFHSFIKEGDFQPIKLEPTILTEYLQNGSLKDIINKEKKGLADHGWNATKKCICLIGVSDAMRYLHGERILHRDLKPENILFDENYYPRICDFGLSRCFSDVLSRSMQFSMSGNVGTPLYMAPELLDSDENHFSFSVDVYSFGMIMYEIISGQVPFNENGKQMSITKLQTKILSDERPKYVNGITKPMWKLLNRCWSKSINERPSFDEIFKELSTNFSYFDEEIDEEEVKNYLDYLNDEKINESDMNKSSKELHIINEQLEKQKKEVIAKKDNEINELKTTRNQVEKQNKDKIEKMMKELSTLKASNDELERKSKDELTNKDKEVEKLKLLNQQLEKQIKAELPKKDKKIDELNKIIDKIKNQNNDEISKKDNEIKELKALNQQLEKQIKVELSKKDKKIDELNKKIDKNKNQNNDEINKKDNEIKELKAANQQLNDQNKNNLTKLNEKIDELKLANEQIEIQKKVETNKENELKTKITKMNKEIVSLKEINQQIETQKNEELIKKDTENNQLKTKMQEQEKQFKNDLDKKNNECILNILMSHQKNEYSFEIIKELIAKHGDIKKFNVSGIY